MGDDGEAILQKSKKIKRKSGKGNEYIFRGVTEWNRITYLLFLVFFGKLK